MRRGSKTTLQTPPKVLANEPSQERTTHWWTGKHRIPVILNHTGGLTQVEIWLHVILYLAFATLTLGRELVDYRKGIEQKSKTPSDLERAQTVETSSLQLLQVRPAP